MRAREPDLEGYVERDGVKIGYEVFGDGSPTVLLLPTWTIVHSRFWKLQVPWLADHHRVLTFDRPGNGRSDRTLDPAAHTVAAVVDHALAVMDATGTDRAVMVGLSLGAQEVLTLAADHPDRVLGAVFIANSLRITGDATPDPKLEPYPRFADRFFAECLTEPHSTKPHEDCVGWALETTPQALLAHQAAVLPQAAVLEMVRRVAAPTLVIHGTEDRVSPLARAEVLARETGGDLVVLEGSGHLPMVRDPVRVNLLLRDFVQRVAPPAAATPRRWTRVPRRRRRALFVSSPIGLGHAGRDIAIAAELRRHHPDLEIEWLAQHPVTRMLADHGERVHPASARMASESDHMDSESGEHRLHCFQAWRRMDEILLADFMVFHDVVTARDYDLVVGDEAWDVDYYLHENPELKRFAYCWLTDFVGWLPMPEGGEREAFLTADYNAEMIGHIARHPRIRDLALFVGNPRDIVPDTFGEKLPRIREWTEAHYRFPGYITGFDPRAVADREALRAELGYAPEERVCVVTVGGSGVGGDLLRRVIDGYPAAAGEIPGLRMLVVAGPRIDPASLPAHDGLDVRAYVPGLYRHLAASDLAIVQGGLTTCMELTAARRPFLYVPLRDHFEQNFHVHHRLQGHAAGRRMDFAELQPDALAAAIKAEIARPVDYRPVESDGAARAAAAIAELL